MRCPGPHTPMGQLLGLAGPRPQRRPWRRQFPSKALSVLVNFELMCKQGSARSAPAPNRIRCYDFSAGGGQPSGEGAGAGRLARGPGPTARQAGGSWRGRGHLSGAAGLAGRDLPPKLNFNPAHKSSKSIPCLQPGPPQASAWANTGIASSDAPCGCRAVGSACPGERGQSCTDRPGGPARDWLLGLAEGPAWLSPAEAWSHQLGALKAWARDPVELWVTLPSEGSCSDRSSFLDRRWVS